MYIFSCGLCSTCTQKACIFFISDSKIYIEDWIELIEDLKRCKKAYLSDYCLYGYKYLSSTVPCQH
jgi:hypothetical protein